jgi:hypothetical protein
MLATLVSGSRLVIATESGHYVLVQQPDVVIEAIHQVVNALEREPEARGVPSGRHGSGRIVRSVPVVCLTLPSPPICSTLETPTSLLIRGGIAATALVRAGAGQRRNR